MMAQPGAITFALPGWVASFSETYEQTTDIAGRMQFIIRASAKNVEMRTGGPFAAGVFEADSGKLVSLGVNLVTTQGLSVLHAEVVALTLAQRILGTFDLGDPELPSHELVTSTEPCAMCFGAIPWSGVRRVVTAAFDEDARRIGFDEGPKVSDWVGALETRGISVITNVEREAARDILRLYHRDVGLIYNSRGS